MLVSSASTPTDTMRSDGAQTLEAIASALLGGPSGPGDADPSVQGGAVDTVVLRLDDLLADSGGDVVLSCGDGLERVVLESPSEIDAQGVAGSSSIASGESVDGMGYISFAGGPTVYYPIDVLVTVSPPSS